jgi:hypothetical protein
MSDEEKGVHHGAAVPIAVDYTAPALVFDGFTTVQHYHGQMSIVLTIGRPTSMSDGTMTTQHRVVCQLCGSLNAMLQLRQAIDNLLLLATPAPESTKN